LVIVHQVGHEKVADVIREFRDEIEILVEVEGSNKIPLVNINTNRILGYQISFDWLQSDWVLAIEEDVEISFDAIEFVSQMMERYHLHRLFRGINLGSREQMGKSDLFTYSRLRYGLHGQAGVITRKVWRHFNTEKLISKSSGSGLDSMLENYLKRGFMITPNASRSLDTGWNGTNAPSDPSHIYFREMSSSWLGKDRYAIGEYKQRDLLHSWRDDIAVFRWNTTPNFFLRKWTFAMRHRLKGLINKRTRKI
jgi:hypothetical protein